MKRILMFFVALTATLPSCNNNDDLWSAIDDLKSRVQALETQVGALNGNVEALQALYSGATITEVVKDPVTGTYTLALSDGQVVELKQGSDVEALIPLIGIDDEGFWQVSTDNGQTWTSLGVKAAAQDGRTPQFRIDEATGYWQVRYADTEEWANVLGTDGQPVKAVGDGAASDKFFEKAELTEDGDSFYIKLLNGTEFTIPVLKDFYCRIVVDKAGVQIFDAGQTRRFAVEMKGVVDALLSAPEGWVARLTDSELIVTAPGSAPATRATADTSKDVAIQAVSAGGFTAIAKIQVETSGQPAVPPTVSVAASTSVPATDATLTFDVTLSANADAWKYLCLKSSEAAPADAASLAANGTAGAGSSVTVSSLDAETEYTIYVVAIHNSDPVLYSDIASATASTTEKLDPNDYYAVGVEVGGVRYSKDSEGFNITTPQVAADAAEDVVFSPSGTPSLFFLGDDRSDAYGFVSDNSRNVATDNIFIGRYADRKPTVVFKRYWALRAPGHTVVFKNLKLDFSAVTENYMFLVADNSGNATQIGGLENLIFEDCEIVFAKANFLSFANAVNEQNYIGNLVFRNCKIGYTGTANSNFVLANQTGLGGTAGFRTVVFENNVVYMPETLWSCVLFNGQNNTFENLDFTFSHNTVVNYLPSGGQGAVLVAAGCGSVSSCSDNLYYSAASLTRASNVFGFRFTGGNPATLGATSPNMAFGTLSGTNAWRNYFGGGDLMTMAASEPFASKDYTSGTFVRTSEAAAFGSSLE